MRDLLNIPNVQLAEIPRNFQLNHHPNHAYQLQEKFLWVQWNLILQLSNQESTWLLNITTDITFKTKRERRKRIPPAARCWELLVQNKICIQLLLLTADQVPEARITVFWATETAIEIALQRRIRMSPSIPIWTRNIMIMVVLMKLEKPLILLVERKILTF